MSGSWESAMVDEAIRYGDPDTRPTHMFKAYKTARQAGLIKGLRPLTSMGKSQEEAFLYGIRTVLQVQAEWGSYPTVEAIWELRRGEASIFYPLFKEDPTIWVECPSDRVHVAGARVTTDYRGECSDCGYDLVSGSLTTEKEQER